ncbi:MAG TPA: SRPBCC family protein [Clostridia bacterium]|nr:SRPBCC family protein [Clostridia bacterium]
MKEFVFETRFCLPRPREEIFDFFAETRSLETITPPWLKFEVLTPAPIVLRVGAQINYRIRVHGVPFRWCTDIVEWQPPVLFTDVQRSGPYRFWRHTHRFEEQNGGTLCIDHVRYWPRGGALLNALFVRRDVERIFSYREQRLKELLG